MNYLFFKKKKKIRMCIMFQVKQTSTKWACQYYKTKTASTATENKFFITTRQVRSIQNEEFQTMVYWVVSWPTGSTIDQVTPL